MAIAATVTTGTAAAPMPSPSASAFSSANPNSATYAPNADGFDLIYMQSLLQGQMASVQTNIQSIESNANLSDTEKMFAMQMAMNTWSAIANLRTNMLKSISDTLKTITRNVN